MHDVPEVAKILCGMVDEQDVPEILELVVASEHDSGDDRHECLA